MKQEQYSHTKIPKKNEIKNIQIQSGILELTVLKHTMDSPNDDRTQY